MASADFFVFCRRAFIRNNSVDVEGISRLIVAERVPFTFGQDYVLAVIWSSISTTFQPSLAIEQRNQQTQYHRISSNVSDAFDVMLQIVRLDSVIITSLDEITFKLMDDQTEAARTSISVTKLPSERSTFA